MVKWASHARVRARLKEVGGSQQALVAGDLDSAGALARRARRWFIGTVIIGGVLELLLLVVLMVLGAFGG